MPRDLTRDTFLKQTTKGKKLTIEKKKKKKKKKKFYRRHFNCKLSGEKRKIIESLAHFVARNGEAFEKIGETKAKNDKKFSFLFGGERASSYAYCLREKQS